MVELGTCVLLPHQLFSGAFVLCAYRNPNSRSNRCEISDIRGMPVSNGYSFYNFLQLYPQVRHFDTPEHEIFVVAYDMEVREYIGYRQLISLGVIIIQGLAFLIILHCNISMSTRNMTISKTTLKMQRMFLNAVYMQVNLQKMFSLSSSNSRSRSLQSS